MIDLKSLLLVMMLRNVNTRRYNEAVDELTKIASTHGIVPPDVFSRDLLEPSGDLGPGAGTAPSTLEPTRPV